MTATNAHPMDAAGTAAVSLAIIDSVLEDNPAAAERVYDVITDSVSRLVTFPEMGRRGRVPGTRGLVIASHPYTEATLARVARKN